MKKFLLVALLATPALALLGCQDAETQRDIAQLRTSVAALQEENQRLRDGMPGEVTVAQNTDVGALLTRLERQERELAALRDSMKNTTTAPASEPVVAKPEGELTPADDPEFDARLNAALERRDEARRAQQAERQAEQMAEAARLAEKYDLEFDPEDPRGSMMRIWSNPETRAKAMEAMRTEMTDRRLAPLNLDEYQKGEVLRIEEATRNKAREAAQNLRDSGATQQEIRDEVKRVQDEQKNELSRVLTPEQLEEYEKSGAGMGGMIPGMGGGDWGGMIPPGMIPGGGGGRGR